MATWAAPRLGEDPVAQGRPFQEQAAAGGLSRSGLRSRLRAAEDGFVKPAEQPNSPGHVVQLVFGLLRLAAGAAEGEVPGRDSVLGVLHLVGSAQVLERLVVPLQPGQRQTEAAQHRLGRRGIFQQAVANVGGFLVVAQPVLGLAQGQKPLPDQRRDVAPEDGTFELVLRGQPVDERFCLVREAFHPGALRRLDPRRQASGAQRRLERPGRKPGVPAGSDQRDPQLPANERAVRLDPVGLGEKPERFGGPSLPQQENAEVEGNVNEGLAGPFLGGLQHRDGVLDLALTNVTECLPELGFRAVRLDCTNAVEQMAGLGCRRPGAGGEQPAHLRQHRPENAVASFRLRQLQQPGRRDEMFQARFEASGGEFGLARLAVTFPLGVLRFPLPGRRQRRQRANLADRLQRVGPVVLVEQALATLERPAPLRLPAQQQPEQ